LLFVLYPSQIMNYYNNIYIHIQIFIHTCYVTICIFINY
jgi:hypothetical protein